MVDRSIAMLNYQNDIDMIWTYNVWLHLFLSASSILWFGKVNPGLIHPVDSNSGCYLQKVMKHKFFQWYGADDQQPSFFQNPGLTFADTPPTTWEW